MIILPIACAILFGSPSNAPQFPHRQPNNQKYKMVYVGWQDEMDSRYNWSPINMENKAFVAQPTKSKLFLGLDKVPANWPYQYQWSGVTRDLEIDSSQYPVLMARVSQVQGYAHLDLELIGKNGAVENTIRTSTLTVSGLAQVDLRNSIPAGIRRLRVRLIVGGPNEGCCATYDWVRFVTPEDAAFLEKNPDWQYVGIRRIYR